MGGQPHGSTVWSTRWLGPPDRSNVREKPVFIVAFGDPIKNQDDFNAKQQEGIRLANERWMEWYGSLDAGPYKNGCYAWNWQDCFAKSIYDPSHDNNGSSMLPNNDSNSASITITIATATPDSNTAFPTTALTQTALFRQEDESETGRTKLSS